tara:strand:+ start:322 stop:714 length:393 start_codon:yes stop_codon:yes gene_type:complete
MKIIKINQFVSGFLIMIIFLLLTKTVLSKENQFECKVKDFKTSDSDEDFIIKNIRKQFLITTTQTSFYLTQISNDYKKNIKTSKGNTWKNTQVYSVLKRYRERQERLELMNRVYEPVWGKMYLKTLKREN